MKSYLRFMAVALVLLTGASVHAAPAEPDAVVREIISKIKAAKNPSPVVEYVDWNNAYTTASPMLRQQMKVNSPEEMKASFQRMLKDPTAMMRERFQEQLTSAPPEQQKAMQQQFSQMETMMKQKEEEMKERIKDTNYEIGKPVIDGKNAKVEIKQTFKGESRTEEVKLVKIGDNWLLPSFMPVGGPGKPAGGASPHAAPQSGAPQSAPGMPGKGDLATDGAPAPDAAPAPK